MTRLAGRGRISNLHKSDKKISQYPQAFLSWWTSNFKVVKVKKYSDAWGLQKKKTNFKGVGGKFSIDQIRGNFSPRKELTC